MYAVDLFIDDRLSCSFQRVNQVIQVKRLFARQRNISKTTANIIIITPLSDCRYLSRRYRSSNH